MHLATRKRARWFSFEITEDLIHGQRAYGLIPVTRIAIDFTPLQNSHHYLNTTILRELQVTRSTSAPGMSAGVSVTEMGPWSDIFL